LPIALAIHGGAWNIQDDEVQSCLDGVRHALAKSWKKLSQGASALDVVERAVRVMEDDPSFDAGRGSHLNDEGKVEMDASIMDGADLRAGAVAAIRKVRHPVSVARQVMERSSHVLLVGEGARKFAMLTGAEPCRTKDLLVGRARERYLRVQAGERHLVDQEFDPDRKVDGQEMGTVGAVALDGNGHLAAATSTGGTQHKMAGRVGDTPIIGAGTYADDHVGAASATGWGEGILRVLLTKTAVDHLQAGLVPEEAADRALQALGRVGGKGGLILVEPGGRLAIRFTTPRMARGWASEATGPRVAVEPGEGQP
jgi:beta-aspartyl-peptidase (threonine type)